MDPIEKSWDLSLYELHRTPQEAITDEVEIAVSAKSLESELRCPICWEILTHTMTTKECLHRFCAKCIITALRSGNKECPTCRKKLVSKRSLRADPNFDRLVETIFPNREEYDAHQDSIIEEINRTHSQNFIATVQVGYKAQMANVKLHNRKNKSGGGGGAGGGGGGDCDVDGNPDSPHHTPITAGRRGAADGDSDEDNPTPPPKKKKKVKGPQALQSSSQMNDDASDSNASGSGAKEVEIVFKLHPHMKDSKDVVEVIKENSTRYIKTTSKALVEHLCKYLAMRITLDMPKPSTEAPGGAPSTSSSGAGPDLGPGSSSSFSSPEIAVKDLSISISPGPGQMVELEGTMALSEVILTYWKANKPLEMFYSFNRIKKE